jgi:NTP pyrophosphatase (non-canonical NTP hydrolase)
LPENKEQRWLNDLTKRLLLEIENERVRQDKKWGVQNHNPDYWMVILLEEVGEAAKAILERDWPGYCNELIEAAAVAVAAVESLHRNGAPRKGGGEENWECQCDDCKRKRGER